MNIIGHNIARLRKAKGVSQKKLAADIGVSRSAVSFYESGKVTPRMRVLEDLAAYFGVGISDIVEGSENASNRPFDIKACDSIEVSLNTGDNSSSTKRTVKVPYNVLSADSDSYAMLVNDDAINRIIPNGCVAIVSPNSQINNGSIAAVSIDGSPFTLRRVYQTPQTLILSADSLSPDQKDIIIPNDSDTRVRFGGKIVWYQPLDLLD